MAFMFLLVATIAAVAAIIFVLKFKGKYAPHPEKDGMEAMQRGYVERPLPGAVKIGSIFGAVVIWVAVFLGTTLYFVPGSGYLEYTKIWGGGSMAPGQIVAYGGENGPQAEILPPGPHFLPPWQFTGELKQDFTVPEGKIAEIATSDGNPMPDSMVFAPEWESLDEFLNATMFLEGDNGYKGQQVSVLKPGNYKFNSRLYRAVLADVINVQIGHVKVVKANYGEQAEKSKLKLTDVVEVEVPLSPDELSAAYKEAEELEYQRQLASGIPKDKIEVKRSHLKVKKTKVELETVQKKIEDPLVNRGQRGVWRTPLEPGQYFMHTKAHEFTDISTLKVRVAYSPEDKGDGDQRGPALDPIQVRSKDGFEFPVDVRIVYHIERKDAPWVVATIGDDENVLDKVMTPAVRSIFRNLVGRSKALDFVADRELRQREAKDLIAKKCAVYGITVDEVLIGRVGSDETLGTLMKTQKDREIALQEQVTFRVQEKAAQQRKVLNKAQQEAMEEKKLAEREYAVKIEDQEKKRKIIEAEARAEQVKIAAKAEAERILTIAKAEADGYLLKVAALGKDTVRTLEAMHIAAEAKLRITPDVMVSGGNAGLIGALGGTMLRNLIKEDTPSDATSQ